jgi:CheY-like chemotaxis protein
MDILIVDDNEDYLYLVKQVLDQNGYTVHIAKDGMEGCEVLTKADIDLIISDIRMPRLDGVKMHAFARETDRYKKTKFIFISGFRDVYSEVINLDPKLDFLLDKTTSVTDLLNLVDELIFGRIAGAWN